MDESLFDGRSQYRISGRERDVRHLRGISDDMVRQIGTELGKPSLTSLPTIDVWMREKILL